MPKVLKSYGTAGAVTTNLCPSQEDVKLKEPVFITFDGLPVPFFIETIEARGNRSIVKFEDIDTLEAAEEIVGKEISFTPLAEEEDEEDGITGRMIRDAEGNGIGIVKEVSDYGGNVCITVDYNGRDVILPFHKDLIIKVKRNGIWLTIPSGLLD